MRSLSVRLRDAPALLALVGLLLLGILMGRAVADPPPGVGAGALVLIALAVLVVSIVVALGPTSCIVAIVAMVVIGWLPVLFTVATVQVTVVDVFYVGLVGWWLIDRATAKRGPSVAGHVPSLRSGGGATLAFLGYVGLTTALVAITAPADFPASLAS
jgi:hypothetical protein